MTIGPSPGSNAAHETDLATLSAEATADAAGEHKKRIPLLWISATIGIGLLIAAIYLGGRIVTAHLHAKPAAMANGAPPPVPVQQAPTLAVAPVSLESDGTKSTPSVLTRDPEDSDAIAPQTGERYLQVGALNLEYSRRFIRRLREEQLDPRLAPGPNPRLLRVLIGPFRNRDELIEQQTQLQQRGIESFVRRY